MFFRPDGRQARGWYYDVWHTACQTAGLSGRLVHDFRRTAVRNLIRAGVPEHVAKQFSGHETRSVFDRYDIVSEVDLAEAVAKPAARHGAAVTPRRLAPLVCNAPGPTGIPTGIPDEGAAATDCDATESWRPQRDSNPCFRLERAGS